MIRPQELGDLLCRRLNASRKAAQKVLGVLQVCWHMRRCQMFML